MRTNTVWVVLSFLFLSCESMLAAGRGGVTVNVDFSKPKQTITGFGASITWIANDFHNFSAADQTTILNSLYSTTSPSAGQPTQRGSFQLKPLP